MGNRAQICIKDGLSKVYLYSHWDGREVYKAAARAVWDVPGRHGDAEYFARAVFCRMVPADSLLSETGYGIGTEAHGDTEHPIPVFDCRARMVEWENHQDDGTPLPPEFCRRDFYSFADAVDAGYLNKE